MSNSNSTPGIRELIHDAVDKTTVTVQNIHKVIVNAPLDALAKADAFEESARQLRETQDTAVKAVYGAVRKINREVQRLGDDLLR